LTIRIAIVLLTGFVFLICAQAEDTLVLWPAYSKQGALPFVAIGGIGEFTFQIARRDSKAGAEVHKNWTYVFAAQAGEATIAYGGEVENQRVRDKSVDDGEIRGSGLIGAKIKKVVAGEVILIPAGLPYQIIIEPGKTFNFFVVKSKKK